ncbi:MAG: hypothetical protein U0939_10625 [Pirellulales bacterium]
MSATPASTFAVQPLRLRVDVQSVRVCASSRLHFGLFSWGGSGRQFGGVGAMVCDPGLELCAERAREFSVEGEGGDRVAAFCETWRQRCGIRDLPALRWRVVRPPIEHVGLGSGTQLGLSVAAVLYQFFNHARPAAQELALSVGRGLRSAIGAYGFQCGGLIVEPGKHADELLSPLGRRVSLPDQWRVVLVRPQVECGLHGVAEKSAFAALPPVPDEVSGRLRFLADELTVAAETADFERFSQSLWDYGALAGSCFTPIQGGPFNGPVLTQLADLLRSLGAVGVGQSSWGPTMFAFQPDESAADRLVDALQSASDQPLSITVAPIDNQGARLTTQLM